MARKSQTPNFDQILDLLRSNQFDVTPSTEVAGGVAVSKYGAAAVLTPRSGGAALAVLPGAWIGGKVARLLDRGYQKFLKTDGLELPATAERLHAIHQFDEELKQLLGAVSLYNESLGTTSDLYLYDRLKGRESAPVGAPIK